MTSAWTYTTPPFPSTLAKIPLTVPEEPSPTELIVEVHAAALNPVDVQLANFAAFKIQALAYPKGLGSDFSGVVIARGNGEAASKFAIGEEVFGLCFLALGKPNQKSLSQKLVLDLTNETTVVLPKPSGMSHQEAASIPLVFLTAITVLSPPYTIIPPKTDERKPTIVFLGGSSSVGIYAIQFAVQKLNATVIATCSAKNADFVKSLGASTVIDYGSETISDRLVELRPKEGYTSIIDCVGGVELVAHQSLTKLLAPKTKDFKEGGAYLTIVGDKTSRTSLGGPAIYFWNPRMVLRHFWGWTGLSPRYACVQLASSSTFLSKVLDLQASGKLQVPIDSEWAWDDVGKAFEKMIDGHAKGKVVIRVKE